jgi:hypothetical protein
VNRADDPDVTHRIELDGAQLSWVQQTEIEAVARGGGQHVVCDIVIIEEQELVPSLDGDFALGKDLSFLPDRMVGGAGDGDASEKAEVTAMLNPVI